LDLKGRAVSGVKWTSLSTFIVTVLQLGQLLVLSRLLSVMEFGLMAIVTIIISLIRSFADLGVTAAVIHFQTTSTEQISTLYWLNLTTGLILYLLLLLVNPLIFLLYPEPGLPELLNIVAISLVIAPIGSLFQTLLQKEMSFNVLAKQEIIATSAATLTTIIMAYLGYGVWSLVIGQLLNIGLRTLMLVGYSIGRYKISFYFNLSDVTKYINFGVYQMGERGINFLGERIDQLVIGSVLGSGSLGLYNFAYNLISQPVTLINPILMKVGFPYFAKLQNDKPELKKAYLRILWVLMLINTPLLLGLGAAAKEIIPVVFDPKWLDSVIYIQILVFVSILRTAANPAGSLMLAVGRADLGFKWNITLFTLSVPLLYTASKMGDTLYIAIALLILQLVLFYPNYKYLVAPFTGDFFKEYILAVLKPVGVFSSMAVVVLTISNTIVLETKILIMILEITAGTFVTLLLSYLFYRKDIPVLLNLLKNE
jgi:O-antigen/teichoic acid export membrane protein